MSERCKHGVMTEIANCFDCNDEKHAPSESAPVGGLELLACPHCHKTTEDKDPNSEQRAVTATTYTPANACVVQCNWCGLSGPILDTIDEAIKAWNELPRKSPTTNPTPT